MGMAGVGSVFIRVLRLVSLMPVMGPGSGFVMAVVCCVLIVLVGCWSLGVRVSRSWCRRRGRRLVRWVWMLMGFMTGWRGWVFSTVRRFRVCGRCGVGVGRCSRRWRWVVISLGRGCVLGCIRRCSMLLC